MSVVSRNVSKLLFAAGTVAAATVMHAATPASADAPAGTAQVNLNLLTPGTFSMDAVNSDLHYRTAGVSSSSDAVDTEIASLSAAPVEGGLGTGTGQYASHRRRSYGRSRYQDRWHNADGSNKIAIMAGAGMTVPVGNTGKFYTPSYTVSGGAGWNFNRMFGVLGEVHYDHAGVSGGALNYWYSQALPVVISEGGSSADLQGYDGNSHVLSVSANPIISFSDRNSKFGAYFTGGVGFYHKVTNFTIPQTGIASNGFYSYYYTSNVNIDSYSANGFGANGGFGLTYKLSEFSSERLFLDARYHWMNLATSNNTEYIFPFNRRNSEYIPVTVGIRF